MEQILGQHAEIAGHLSQTFIHSPKTPPGYRTIKALYLSHVRIEFVCIQFMSRIISAIHHAITVHASHQDCPSIAITDTHQLLESVCKKHGTGSVLDILSILCMKSIHNKPFARAVCQNMRGLVKAQGFAQDRTWMSSEPQTKNIRKLQILRYTVANPIVIFEKINYSIYKTCYVKSSTLDKMTSFYFLHIDINFYICILSFSQYYN